MIKFYCFSKVVLNGQLLLWRSVQMVRVLSLDEALCSGLTAVCGYTAQWYWLKKVMSPVCPKFNPLTFNVNNLAHLWSYVAYYLLSLHDTT